ncbi:hypothetical protein MRX96_003754 [Rhipicephalus microplus]
MAEPESVAAVDASTSKSLRLHLQDSRRSWFTLAMCMVMAHTATMGNRSQGAMYVGIREHFGASHGEASLPPSLQSSLCLVGGIFTGFLCEVTPMRYMSLGSSLLLSLALMVCYFGLTVSFISFFFGVVHGLAANGMFVVTSVVVGEYFVRWRATAYALSAAAKSSHFLTPFVANHIRVHYGTPEIFLLLGALSLNGFVAALLVRTPPWRLHLKSKDAGLARLKSGASKEHSSTSVKDENTDATLQGVNNSTTADVAFTTEPLLEEVPLDHEECGSYHTPSGPEISFQEHSVPVTAANSCKVSNTCSKAKIMVDERPVVIFSASPTLWSNIMAFLRRSANTLSRIDWKVLVSPLFLFDTLSFSLQNYVLSNFVLLYLDMALECGVDASFASYLLLAFNVSVVLSSLVSGFVIDRRVLSMNATMILGFCGNAASCEGLAWSRSGGQLLACAVVQGLSCGAMVTVVCPVIIRDFGSERLPLVIGGCHTVMGVVLLARPSLIGYFKDVLGSYVGIQHTFASLNAFLAILWMIRLMWPKCPNCG